MFEAWTIDRIKRENRAAGQHFFSSATMKFFDSRILAPTWTGTAHTYFVTSEQPPEYSDGSRDPRTYSVRRFNHETAVISTVNGKFSKPVQAYDAARDLAVAERGVKTCTACGLPLDSKHMDTD